jgi:transcriptional regulator with XRE-family HTH domain
MLIFFNPYSLLNLRRKNKLTQAELGKRIGKNKATIVHWETGNKQPRKSNIVALAKEFSVPIDFFYDDKANKNFQSNVSGNNVQGNNNVINNSADIELLKKEVEILKLQIELLKNEKNK